MSQSVTQLPGEAPPANAFARYFAGIMGVGVMIGILLFLVAGRLDWLWGWVYVGLWFVTKAFWLLVAVRGNRDLATERLGRHANTKRWDRVIMTLYLLCALAIFVVAGLDGGRYHWSDPVPLVVALIAIALHLISQALAGWTTLTNTFLSREARIQTERGHEVVSGGPYRYVRHPLYVATIALWLTSPPILDSWWAMLPAVGACGMMVIRTALEDRMLHRELPGYAEYARRTRYRLLPGLW